MYNSIKNNLEDLFVPIPLLGRSNWEFKIICRSSKIIIYRINPPERL